MKKIEKIKRKLRKKICKEITSVFMKTETLTACFLYCGVHPETLQQTTFNPETQ